MAAMFGLPTNLSAAAPGGTPHGILMAAAWTAFLLLCVLVRP